MWLKTQHVHGRRRDDPVEGIGAVRAVVLRPPRRVSVRAVPARHDPPRREGAESASRRPDGPVARTGLSYWPPIAGQEPRGRRTSSTTPTRVTTRPRTRSSTRAHQERFRRFIEAYGGKLVHVVYRNHEGRAWIYKVQKLLPRPKITFRAGDKHLRVRGKGFRFNSRVTLYYHQRQAGSVQGRQRTARSRAGSGCRTTSSSRYCLVATDNFGNYASTVGLEPTLRNRRARRRIAERVRREEGRDPRTRPAEGPPGRGPLNVELEMPKQTPVGRPLPVKVHVKVKVGERSCPRRRPISSSRSTPRTARRRCGGGSG